MTIKKTEQYLNEKLISITNKVNAITKMLKQLEAQQEVDTFFKLKE